MKSQKKPDPVIPEMQRILETTRILSGVLASIGLIALWVIGLFAAYIYSVMVTFSAGENENPSIFAWTIFSVVLLIGAMGAYKIKTGKKRLGLILLALYFGWYPAIIVVRDLIFLANGLITEASFISLQV